MKKRTIIIGIFILFLVGVISIIGTYAIDSTITEGNSSTADYLFNITLGNRTNREVVIPSYDSKIVDIKISNPNEFNMSYLLYIEGVNSNISVINIKDTEASGVLASKTVTIIQAFIQNNSSSDITIKIKDIVGFEKEILSLPDNSTSINKGSYYKAIVKSNNKTYGKVKPNIKLSTLNGTVKYKIVPNTGYKYKSTTCNGSISNNILTISNITSNVNCEVVFEPIEVTVSFDVDGGEISATYTETKEHTYTVPYSGIYKLEVWGAQGGNAICNGSSCSNRGGYGGYATGEVYLTKNQQIFANVGGQGSNGKLTSAGAAGGYNGGGSGTWDNNDDEAAGGGGGATHIATKSGLLSALSNNIPDVLIVAGGGGGASWTYATGNGGGYVGGHTSTTNTSYPTQTSGYSFGQGQNGSGAANSDGVGGGGGGFYGGYANNIYDKSSGTGGSGYIGNSLLSNKYMYCYDCDTSDEVNTKTYTTTNVSSTPTTNYAKSGAGAAKITLKNVNNTINYGEKYSNLPIPTKEGHTFIGWYTEPNGQGTKITEDTVLINTSNHTLYAYWLAPINVSFDTNGGSYNISTTYTEAKEHTYTVPYSGTYKLELWGAQGGGTSSLPGGYGSYVSGNVNFNQNDNLYIYVGENYNGYKNSFCFNGGGRGSYGTRESDNYNGGGATDIRYFGTYQPTEADLSWDSTIGLNSRIIVAAGGGGYTSWTSGSKGGNAGGLIGGAGNRNGSIVNSTGGTQTSGGNGTNNTSTTPMAGVFGAGGYGSTYTGDWIYNAGGGGGFYGGGSGGAISGSVGSAAGGSSFISGHTGCVAITSSSSRDPRTGSSGASCSTGTTDNLCSVHYSGKVFTGTVMIDGSGYAWTSSKGSLQQMPKPSGGYYSSGVGHTGSGAAKISFVGNASYLVSYGQKYGSLPTPTKEGYTFLGWYTEPNGQGTKITEDTVLTIANNHTLYAHWQADTYYTIAYDYRNNIYNQNTSTWTLSGNNSHVDNTYSYNGTTALYLASSSLYTGTRIPINEDKKQNTNYKLSIKAYRTTDFSGNLRAYSGTFDSTGSVISWNNGIIVNTSNLSLNTWKEYNYSFNTGTYSSWNYIYIDYDTENQGPVYVSDIRLDEYTTGTVKYGSNYTNLPTPTRTGYTFLGWYTGKNGAGTKITSDSIVSTASDHTLYAHWQVNTYTITYNLNGGTAGSSAPTSGTYGSTVTVSNPTRSGYTFNGWTVSGTGASMSGTTLTIGAGNVTLTANWKINDSTPPTCSLSANASTITATASDTGGSGLAYNGWSSSYSGTNSTSKSIAIGTHTYYVKDGAGNTGTCSATISATTENCDCGAGFYQSGACYIGVIENGKWVGNKYYKECDWTYTCSSGTKLSNSYCFKAN